MKKKTISDSRLDALWRKAVLKKCKHMCILTFQTGDSNLECHHYVKRKNVLLRWDYRNGFALTKDMHRYVHSRAGNRILETEIAKDTMQYLFDKERILFKDYLRANHITRDEFKLLIKKELDDYIRNN